MRREGDSFYFTAVTDKAELEHRCDWLVDQAYCTCWGFLKWRHCKHAERVTQVMNDQEPTTAIAVGAPGLPQSYSSPLALRARLADLKEERALVATYFKDVMEEGVDYGVIPGTDKPTLFKAGAEKLCEFYGYAPMVKDRQETIDYKSGFYRCVITMALIHRGSGTTVAEGVGECNTREARYFYRWVTETNLKKTPELYAMRASLKQEKRSGRSRGSQGGTWEATYYRLENDDLFTLWNTVLKMAKKRALVDVTLSSTRSSGLFSRGAEKLSEFIDAEYQDITDDDDDEDEAPKPQPPAAPTRQPRQAPPPNVDPATGEMPQSAADNVRAAVALYQDLKTSLDQRGIGRIDAALDERFHLVGPNGAIQINRIQAQRAAELLAWLQEAQRVSGVPKEAPAQEGPVSE